MPTFFVDYENGNDNYGGTSFNILASGADGAIASPPTTSYSTFSSATANFPNDGTIVSTKNLAWYANDLYLNTLNSNSIPSIVTSINAPSGIDARVYLLTEDSSLTTHYLSSNTWYTPIYTGTQYTLSIYAKSGGRNKVILRYGGSDAKSARYNLSNGTVEDTGASASATISSNLGNGWYRLTLTITTSAGTAGAYVGDNWEIYLLQDSFSTLTASSSSYQGDSSSGVYICGMQIEAAAGATTYNKPPAHMLSIFNGSSYISFYITERIGPTSLRINLISGGTAISTQSSRQYFIGGRWKTLTNGATAIRLIADDTVRIMGSPDPTSIGSGTWVGSKMTGSNSISSSTNTSPITVSCASTMATLGISNGDTVTIVGHTTNTNANGTWEVSNISGSTCSLIGSSGNGVGGASGFLKKISNQRVLLSSSPIINIASHGNRGNGRTSWTAQTVDVTTSLNLTDFKEGDCSDSITIGGNFTTGLAAYKATGSLNLSGYQQISFWIKQTSGTVGADSAISIRLCSDTAGATPVNTFNIENLIVINRWIPITINLGTNLGNNIQSIAFYVNTDNGTQTFLLSNIIACKSASSDDSLNLCSLIGKNTSNETWCAIQSINGTRVILDTDGQSGPVNTTTPTNIVNPGYSGTSETVTTYKRETIKVPMSSTSLSTTTSLLNMTDSGPATNPILYTFGWNRTDMSARTGESWFDGRNGWGYSNYTYYVGGGGSLIIDRACYVRFAIGLYLPGCNYCVVTNCHNNNNSSYGLYTREARGGIYNNIFNNYNNIGIYAFSQIGQTSFTNIVSNSNYNIGVQFYNIAGVNTMNNFTITNNVNGVYLISAHNLLATSGTISDSWQYGLRSDTLAYNNTFRNTTFANNTTAAIRCNSTGPVYLANCNVNDSVEAEMTASVTYAQNSQIFSHNHDNTKNNHIIFCEGGRIFSTTSVRRSNSGLAWTMTPTSTLRDKVWPLSLRIATVAVNANSLVTVKAWMMRNSIALTTGLRLKGGQIDGVTNDITSYMTAAADTWQEVTLTFTPTEVGVVEILAECWGGTTFTAYIDDISITQV